AFSKLTEDAVFRVAMPIDGIYKLLGRVRFFIWTVTVVLLALSWLFYFTLVRRTDEALLRFKKMVKGFEQGNYNQRFPVVRDDGVGEIGQSMNSLARELERKIRALAEERDRFKTILDAMQEGVIVLDAEGNISLFNPAMRQLFGLKDEDLGRPPIEVIRNADLQSIVEESLKGNPVANKEIRILRDGWEHYLLVQATGFWEESVAAMGAIVVLYDITNLRRLERVRRDFVANVSHELKTPLTSIRGYVEILQDSGSQLNEQSRNFLGIIETNTHRLGKLVEDLLRLSEIESQQFVLKPEIFRVQELFGEVLDLHDSLLKKKAMAVDVSIEPENLELYADRMALLHMLNNLVENAIKYGYPETTIQLQCRSAGETAVFRVQDRGIGIAGAHLERIFERFYRVDKSRSKQEGSTGLGLAIVKHLVQLMGGEITVESLEEQGSTFIFRLPRAVASQAPESLAK
ncbi:MAG TPA: ATP-binding protein, partial [bacterium]|nr:ATP-binding protein [bacterium]